VIGNAEKHIMRRKIKMSNEEPPFAPEICKHYKKRLPFKTDDKTKKIVYCTKDGCRHYCDGKCCFPAESLAGWLDYKYGIVRSKDPDTFFVKLEQSNNITGDLRVMSEKIEFNNEEDSKTVFKIIREVMKEYKK